MAAQIRAQRPESPMVQWYGSNAHPFRAPGTAATTRGPWGRQPWDTAAGLRTHFAAVPSVAVDNPRQHWVFSSSRAPQGAPPSGNRFSGGPSGVMSEARHHLWLARPQGPIFVNRLGAGRN